MAKRTEVGDAIFYVGDPREDGGIETIDDVYQSCLHSVREPKPRPYLWGADAGLCPRKNVFLKTNPVPFVYYPSTCGYMAIGIAIEDMLAKALKSHDRLILQDIRLVDLDSTYLRDFKISGKMDIITLDHKDKLALVECKTCGPLPSQPKTTHLIQLLTYAAVSGFDNCYLTYVSRRVSTQGAKGKLEVVSFPIEITEDLIWQRLYIAALSHISLNAERVVPVPADFRKSHECIWCDYDSFCWPYEDSPIPLFGEDELSVAKHIAINAADELMVQRPERYTRTLEGLLERGYDESGKLKEEYEAAKGS